MHLTKRLYYRLTAYVPRLLPRTEDELLYLREVCIHAYGVPDTADCWKVVMGHILNTPAHKMHKPWGQIANAAKRLTTNGLAHSYRLSIDMHLQSLAEKAAQKEIENQDLDKTKSEPVASS